MLADATRDLGRARGGGTGGREVDAVGGAGLVRLDDSEAREHTELLGEFNARAEASRRAAAR